MLLIFFSVSALFIMQRQGFFDTKPLFYCLGKISARVEIGHSALSFHLFVNKSTINSCQLKATINRPDGVATFVIKECFRQKISKIKSTLDENVEELYGDDDELCPVECVREFKTDEELSRIMENAKESNALVVVDFYRTSCGSCKYIEQGFMKLCKGSGKQDSPAVFLKHNVLDEYDERSEVTDRLRIRSVPLFHFYKNGVLLEAFPTRDKERILEAITKYTASSSTQEVDSIT